jgi:energy-coupling factor transporter transmembrane protein EcfT
MDGETLSAATTPTSKGEGGQMVLLLALLIVLIFFGIGFTVHFLWIIAAVLLVLWLAGMAVGRGESAGRHRFYRW